MDALKTLKANCTELHQTLEHIQTLSPGEWSHLLHLFTLLRLQFDALHSELYNEHTLSYWAVFPKEVDGILAQKLQNGMISPKLFIELEKEEENVRKSSTQSLEGIKTTISHINEVIDSCSQSIDLAPFLSILKRDRKARAAKVEVKGSDGPDLKQLAKMSLL